MTIRMPSQREIDEFMRRANEVFDNLVIVQESYESPPSHRREATEQEPCRDSLRQFARDQFILCRTDDEFSAVCKYIFRNGLL